MNTHDNSYQTPPEVREAIEAGPVQPCEGPPKFEELLHSIKQKRPHRNSTRARRDTGREHNVATRGDCIPVWAFVRQY